MERDRDESLLSYRPTEKLAAAAIFGDAGLRFLAVRKGPLNSSTLFIPPPQPEPTNPLYCSLREGECGSRFFPWACSRKDGGKRGFLLREVIY